MTRDLSGEWDGIFNYPRLLPPTAFTAILREHGGQISGETTEPGDTGTLFGLIDGARAGSRVTFVKTYDDHHAKAIHYAGTLDADATEVSGTWRIPGDWSGSFIMVRKTGDGEAVKRTVAETAAR